MTTMKIISIEKDTVRGIISIIKELTEDDGTIHLNQHFFPEDTVEWKMAEYDTDEATALDIILHEPFTNPATYKHVHQFDSKAEALTHARSAISAIKRDMKTRNDQYPQILEHCVIHAEALELKRAHIDKAFEMKANEKERGSQKDSDNRIALLKAKLKQHERKFGV